MSKTNQQRKLLVVPILHSQKDMGTLADRLPKRDGYSAMVSTFWQEVGEKVKCYINGVKKLKVYQDGLPDTKEELVEKILHEVKSPNYDLLRFLKSQGAKIYGTEDPKLLDEEYKFVSQILKTQDEAVKNKLKQSYEKQAAALLSRRDSYIAKRIDKTLKQGDLGILFLGAVHQILPKLSKDIKIFNL